MRTALLAVVACTFVQSSGQQSFRLQPFDFNTSRLSLRSFELVIGGDYICVGGYKPTLSDQDHGFISRVSPGAQSILWSYMFESGTIVTAVAKTQNGEYVASCQDVLSTNGFVIRFTSAGTVLWRRDITGGTFLRCISEAPDGNIWAGGNDFNREFLACFTPAGVLLWDRHPPTGTQSFVSRIIPDGTSMVIFGNETFVIGGIPNLEGSVRRFDLAGLQTSHQVFGTEMLMQEAFYDAVRLPNGMYVAVTQHALSQIGVIYFDATLVFQPLMTRAYVIGGSSMTAPKLLADASSLYIFCTNLSAIDGGTEVMKIDQVSGAIQNTESVARGFTQVNRLLWNGGFLVMPSCQDPVAIVGAPPETIADFAILDPVTLLRTMSCVAVGDPPGIVLGTYPSPVSAIIADQSAWIDAGLSVLSGALPTVTALDYYDCNEALPVELTSFTGIFRNFGVELTWTTATEHDNAYFDVMRSTDGFNFSAIDRVIGVGNSIHSTLYTSFDPDLSFGTSYYRLRQVDIDGEESWSETIAMNLERLEGEVEYFDASGKSITSMPSNQGTYFVRPINSVGTLKKVVVIEF